MIFQGVAALRWGAAVRGERHARQGFVQGAGHVQGIMTCPENRVFRLDPWRPDAGAGRGFDIEMFNGFLGFSGPQRESEHRA